MAKVVNFPVNIPALMFTATVVTGNHYFLDGALGILVATLGLLIALRVDRLGAPKPSAGPAQAPHSV